jgi:hypothetical protein
MWVWMRPHIRFCTIGKCDLLYCFLSIEYLPAAGKSHSISFLLLKHEAFHMRFHLFFFSILAPFSFSLFFRSLSLSLEDPSFVGRDFTHWIFLGESLGK